MTALTQKGQVTVPKAVRQILDLHTGDEVEFVVKDRHVELKRSRRDHRSAYGLLKSTAPAAAKVVAEDSGLMDALIEDDDRIRGQHR
jgi:AbrB family looped-hinge helix DNA binding protein